MGQNYQQPPTSLAMAASLMMFHQAGPPLGSSVLGDPRTNMILETCKLSIHFAANFFLSRNGTLESRGLVGRSWRWLDAAGFNSIKKQRMFFVTDTILTSGYLGWHVTFLSRSNSHSAPLSYFFHCSLLLT